MRWLLFMLLGLPTVVHAQLIFTTNNGSITITGYKGNPTVLVIPAKINNLPVTSIGSNAFAGAFDLVSVTLPNSLVSIGDDAFLGCGITNINIPNSVKSLGVESFISANLISVTIGAGVTNIPDRAFMENDSLLRLSIPTNVVSIGGYSFEGCPNLVNLTIGNGVTSIGDFAFSEDESIRQLIIPNSVVALGFETFADCMSLTNLIIGNGVTIIPTNCFADSGTFHLTLTIGSNVTTIAENAFGGDGGLFNVSIPNNVINLGNYAFYYCDLTNAIIGNGVTAIEDSVFAGCSRLASVAIGSGVTNIGDSAFIDFPQLTSISVNPNNPAYTSVDGVLFDHAQTTLIRYPPGKIGTAYTMPDSVTDIHDSAFRIAANLTDVFIDASVTTLEPFAFASCDNLSVVYFEGNAPSDDGTEFAYDNNAIVYYQSGTTGWDTTFGGLQTVAWLQQGPFIYTVTNGTVAITQYIGNNGIVAIPDTINSLPVTSLAASSFMNCSSLTNVIIGTNVASLGQNAFDGCNRMVRVTIPESVNDIEDYAFENSGLIAVRVPDSVTNLGGTVFRSCLSLTNAIIGNQVSTLGDSLFYECSNLTSVTIPGSVANIADNAFEGSGLVKVTIPDSVTSIGQNVFSGCTKLTAIHLSTNLETIGDSAFHGCSVLARVLIPNSVTSLGDYAFADCSNLTSAVISENITSIGMAAFADCGLTSVVIPNAVWEIWDDAFKGCRSLTKVVMGAKVSAIFDAAFYGCSNLTGLYFGGNAPTTVGPGAFGSDPKATIYYLPGATGWTSTFNGLAAVKLGVTNPVVTISSPVNGQHCSNNIFRIAGTAHDQALVSGVWFRVNSSDWQPATTTNEWATWTAPASVIPGTNVIQAVATNVFSYGSTNVSAKLDYIVSGVLQVHTAGLGTFSPNYSNALLQIGANYSLKATPATGFVFTNWTTSGGALSNNATLQFMMASNLMLQAAFVETSKPSLTITAPTANQRMTNAFAAVAGTAGDNWQVSGVWYQLNNGAWNLATTTNRWTNWTTTLPLIAGTNTIKAYALNWGGNQSVVRSVNVVSSNTFKLLLTFAATKPLLTNGLTFSLQLSSNLNGHIEYSTNLLNWISWTNFRGTNTTITFRDPAATNSAGRFYRAVVP